MPANDPKSKANTDVGSSEKRFKMKNPVISRLLDMARRAQDNPEAFRNEFVADAARVGEGVEKMSAFAKAARASIANNPEVKRGVENVLISLLGENFVRAVQRRDSVNSNTAPRESTPMTAEEAHVKYHRSHAHEPRRRYHPKPYAASPIDEFVRELFFRRGRRKR